MAPCARRLWIRGRHDGSKGYLFPEPVSQAAGDVRHWSSGQKRRSLPELRLPADAGNLPVTPYVPPRSAISPMLSSQHPKHLLLSFTRATSVAGRPHRRRTSCQRAGPRPVLNPRTTAGNPTRTKPNMAEEGTNDCRHSAPRFGGPKEVGCIQGSGRGASIEASSRRSGRRGRQRRGTVLRAAAWMHPSHEDGRIGIRWRLDSVRW